MSLEALPKHIAIVMDGNGRWAERQGLTRSQGHEAGYLALKQIVEYAATRGIQVLSVFAFSTENWLRPQSEVEGLMALFLLAVEKEIDSLKQHNIRLRFIGDRAQLSPEVRDNLTEAEQATCKNTGMTFVIALNYGGRWDILNACRKLSAAVAVGELRPAEIDASHFEAALSTADLPEPDLFIRTSGEVRLSNFFLWQLAYTECYFLDKYWPDFNTTDFDQALAAFQRRHRRYGETTTVGASNA